MQYYEFIACRGDTGAVLPLAKVTVFLAGTTTLASIFDSTGAGLANPTTAASSGLVGIAAANGRYDFQIASADGTYLAPPVHGVQFYDLANLDAAIATLKSMTISADRYQIKYDGTGAANPSVQTITLTATKKNTTATVTWSIADLAGNPVTPASTYLSAATGDTVTMTRPNFDSARGTTQGLIFTGTATDGSTFTSSITVVVNQDGAAGTNGTTGNTYIGQGVPANNQFANGDTYVDSTTGLTYGQKTGGKWSLGTVADVNAATPGRMRIDLRAAGATLPTTQATVTRASSSTDMLPTDPYTYSPTTYGNNLPVIRPGKGLLVFTRAQQLLANPGAPVTETVTVPVGVVAVTAWGPAGSALVSAAGTAVGTGFGSLSGTAGAPQYITITTAGTITLTPSGSLTKANVVYNPSIASATEAVPYIATQSIREADQIPAGSALLAAMQSTQGYLLMGISDVRIRNYGAPADILGLNNLGAWFVNSNSVLSMSDPAFHNTGSSLGNDTFANGATIGRTWDASATGTFGGGSCFEASHPFAYNNGVAVTAASLGGPKGSGNTSGQNILNGCIGWWEYDTTARLSDEALWNAYTSQPAPALDSLLKNYAGPTQFSKFLASVHQLRAGVVDHVKVGIIGPSHEGGVGLTGDTDIRSNSWASQMLADLETDGYSVAEAFCGTGSATFSGGTMKHDARITYTGTAPTAVDVDFGKTYVVIPAGTVVTFTPGRSNSRCIAYFYTAATGRGTVEVSTDGGTTPIAANETSSTSNSTTSATFTGSITGGVLTTTGTTGTIRVGDRLTRTTGVVIGTAILAQLSGTAGGDGTYSVSITTTTTSASMSTKALIVRTYDTALANNAWSIKAVGNPVHLCLCYAYNPAAKSFVFFNGGANGYNVGNLSLDDDVESSYAYPVRVLGCSLWFGCGDDTNDMNSGGTAWATYNQQATAILTNAQLSGSVVLFTDPESTLATFARALSDRITEYGRTVGWTSNIPIYDFYAYYNSDPVKCQWDILNPNLAYNDTTHLTRRANKRFKSNQMRTLFKRIVALA
jgi:hypothetical protein